MTKRSIAALAACLLLACAAGGASRAAAADPSEAAAHVAAADAALAGFDLDRAVADYRSAHDLAPHSAETAWKLSRALIYQAMLTKDAAEERALCVAAAALARDAIAADPASAMGHTMLAVADGRLADRERDNGRKIALAREIWSEANKALQADPDQDLALHVLGMWNRGVAEVNPLILLAAQLLYGRLPPASFDASVGYLRRAADLKPEAVAHHVELGVTLMKAGQRDEARAQLELGLSLPEKQVIDGYYRTLARRGLRRLDDRPPPGPKP